MVDDGVIKFHFSQFKKTGALEFSEYSCLEECRNQLVPLNLIGEYQPEAIGFGNLSLRKDYSRFKQTDFPQFLISGTQTGKFKNLTGEHFTRVIDGSLQEQSISCQGPIQASSESLTHAGIYLASKSISAIVHVHHKALWEKMLESDYPRTKKETAYGTLEMALEVGELIKANPSGILVMEGHQDGVVFYGQTLAEATRSTLETFHLLVT